jgi:hypothetical protein
VKLNDMKTRRLFARNYVTRFPLVHQVRTLELLVPCFGVTKEEGHSGEAAIADSFLGLKHLKLKYGPSI